MGNDSTQLCPLSCMAPEEWLSHDNNPYPGLVGNKKYIHFLPKFLSVYLSANFFSLKFWSCVTFCLGNKTKQKKKSKKYWLCILIIFFSVSKVGGNVWLYWSDWERAAWETSSDLLRQVYRGSIPALAFHRMSRLVKPLSRNQCICHLKI